MQADFADLAANLIDDVLRARPIRRRDHHMSDPKAAIGRQRGTQSGFRQPFRPELSRNIGQYANAVTFAVNVSGAMAHPGERFNCPFDVAVRRLAAFAH